MGSLWFFGRNSVVTLVSHFPAELLTSQKTGGAFNKFTVWIFERFNTSAPSITLKWEGYFN